MPRRVEKTPHHKVVLGLGNKNDQIQTPPTFLAGLCKLYSVEEFFDPCPLERPDWDGLKVDWGKNNYVNPPFSEIKKWLHKGAEEKAKGNRSLFLITLRPNCKYWAEFVWPHVTGFWLLERNLKFVGFERAFPVALCLVEFDPAKPVLPTSSLELKESVSLRYFETLVKAS